MLRAFYPLIVRGIFERWAHMTAKEYLLELKLMKIKIKQLQEKRQMYLDRAVSITSVINPVKVQSGLRVDKVSDNVIKAVDIDRQLETDIFTYLSRKNDVINKIQNLNCVVYMQILFKKYVEFKTLEVIAKEMDMSFSYVKHVHGKALAAFTEMYSNVLTDGKEG